MKFQYHYDSYNYSEKKKVVELIFYVVRIETYLPNNIRIRRKRSRLDIILILSIVHGYIWRIRLFPILYGVVQADQRFVQRQRVSVKRATARYSQSRYFFS